MRKNKKDKIKLLIKKEIENVVSSFGLLIDRIILFGSRTGRNFDSKSDWDVLVILKENISFDVEIQLSKEIRKKLAKNFIPCDILIRTPRDIDKFKDYVHSITKIALQKGLIL